ncbi:MAG: ribonuclease E/G, partial [Betaproteobacteria bacterium]|nr:ribonuclease E/G [Betaproteobacteria bacterium]
TRIKLMGHWLLLEVLPRTASGLMVTRAASGKEKADIMAGKDSLSPPSGMNLIVRSSGLDVKSADLIWEFNSYLLPLWKKIGEVAEQFEGPQLIYNDMDIINRCVREHFTPAVTELVCDSDNTAGEVKQLFEAIMPDMANRVTAVAADAALFDERVLGQIDALLTREVLLPSGGALVIDVTEALVAIDVNSGRNRGQSNIEDTAFKTNCEAAEEVARQLRLRNLSGIIAIDFIDMEVEENKTSLVTSFSKALRRDRAQIQVGSLSEFGILEMTRQNIGRALHEAHSTLCNKCGGVGRIPTVRSFVLHQLDKLHDLCIKRKQCGMVTMLMPIEPATYLLNEHRGDLRRLEEQFGVDIVIVPSRNLEMPEVNVRIDKVSSLSTAGSSYDLGKDDKSEASAYRDQQTARRQAVPAISNYKPEPRRRHGQAAAKTARAAPQKQAPQRKGIIESLFGMFRTSDERQTNDATEPAQKRKRPQQQQGRSARPGNGPEKEVAGMPPRKRSGRRRGGRRNRPGSGSESTGAQSRQPREAAAGKAERKENAPKPAKTGSGEKKPQPTTATTSASQPQPQNPTPAAKRYAPRLAPRNNAQAGHNSASGAGSSGPTASPGKDAATKPAAAKKEEGNKSAPASADQG